jgi:hypothetical protein
LGLFSRGINVESGILFPDGWFRTGTRPDTGRPTTEIYAVTDKDDPLDEWWLVQQERLSHTPRWKDDYFQIWAEVLANLRGRHGSGRYSLCGCHIEVEPICRLATFQVVRVKSVLTGRHMARQLEDGRWLG